MNGKIIKRTIEIAHALCPTNKNGLRTSHVAFLVRKNKIVKIGLNKNRTHPEISRHPYHEGYVGIHAELDCILKTDRENLSDCEIVVLRIDKNSKLNNSKPCAGCASLLRQFNLKKIYYSTSDGKIESYS